MTSSEDPQVADVADLRDVLGSENGDLPIYATTPHGTYTFVIERIERTAKDDEDVLMLRLRPVSSMTEIGYVPDDPHSVTI